MRLLHLFALLSFLPFCHSANKCTESFPFYTCHGASVIIIDGTNDMRTHDEIKKEFEYIENHIVPHLCIDNEYEVTFMVSGVCDKDKWERKYVSSHKAACSELESLFELTYKHGLEKESLKKIMQQIAEHYEYKHPVILFSKSEDRDEIAQAAEYARMHIRNEITVVAIGGNTAAWRSFPAVSVFAVHLNEIDLYNRLPYCIAERSCAITTECNPYGDGISSSSTKEATTSTISNKITYPNTHSVTKKLLPSTHTSPETSDIPYVDGSGCLCNYSTSWNDVMFVFESTEATTETGLQEMLVHVQSNLNPFNIQPYLSVQQFYTRIGIVVYGRSSLLYAALGSLSREEFLSIESLPYFGDKVPNLETALRMAASQFQSEADRYNARNVIVLMAVSYYAGGLFGASEVAAQFKEDNGVLIVYNYIEEHGFAESRLKEIASPGYFLSNTDDKDGDGIRRALCDANCFCRLDYDAFEMDPLRYTPTAGCYSVKQIQTSYQLAVNQCKNAHGFVALTKQQKQVDYLEQKSSSGSSFWIGLLWNQQNQCYLWADGSFKDVKLTQSYQPWAYSTTHQSGLDCVRVVQQGPISVWSPVDCREEFIYFCEVGPCDSETYCVQDV